MRDLPYQMINTFIKCFQSKTKIFILFSNDSLYLINIVPTSIYKRSLKREREPTFSHLSTFHTPTTFMSKYLIKFNSNNFFIIGYITQNLG